MKCTNSPMKAIKIHMTVQLVSKLHRNMYCSTQPDNTVGYALIFMKFIPEIINLE